MPRSGESLIQLHRGHSTTAAERGKGLNGTHVPIKSGQEQEVEVKDDGDKKGQLPKARAFWRPFGR